MVIVDERAFDPGVLLSAFCRNRTESGGVVTFTGLCRSNGKEIAALTLDAHPTYTRSEIARIESEAQGRWPLHDVLIRHRHGRIVPGEAIVFVAVAAAHRRAAFEAADFLMDQLKTRAPFWKKEEGEGGSVWLEPKDEEQVRARRWEMRA